MSQSLHLRSFAAVLVSAIGIVLAPGCNGEDVGSAHQPLTAVCVEHDAAPPAGAWICAEATTVECNAHEGAWVDYIYVPLGEGAVCASTELTVSAPGPFLPGTYTISVSAETNGRPVTELCTSTLTIVDTVPPVVTPKVVELWPPNHKYHHISPLDCVTIHDACDAAPSIAFTWASSDEPDDDLGDGSTGGDIANLGCDGVDLRSERQGGSDGRVYTLGYVVTDHAGNVTEGSCQVVVPHDQGKGSAVDSGEAHRVDLAAGSCQ